MSYNVRFYHAPRIYAQLPMIRESRLPDGEVSPRKLVVGTKYLRRDGKLYDEAPVWAQVYVKNALHGKHRVIVLCPCGRSIPFGRMNQHFKVCERVLSS